MNEHGKLWLNFSASLDNERESHLRPFEIPHLSPLWGFAV